jgi:hypothetical protein
MLPSCVGALHIYVENIIALYEERSLHGWEFVRLVLSRRLDVLEELVLRYITSMQRKGEVRFTARSATTANIGTPVVSRMANVRCELAANGGPPSYLLT